MAINSTPSYFLDDSAVATRTAEVPDADWAGGATAAASNAPCIGAGLDQPNVAGTPEQFTLLDQDGAARTPQVSQSIGGTGVSGTYPSSGGAEGKGIDALRFGTNNGDGSGEVTGTGNAHLATLAAGWEAV